MSCHILFISVLGADAPFFFDALNFCFLCFRFLSFLRVLPCRSSGISPPAPPSPPAARWREQMSTRAEKKAAGAPLAHSRTPRAPAGQAPASLEDATSYSGPGSSLTRKPASSAVMRKRKLAAAEADDADFDAEDENMARKQQ